MLTPPCHNHLGLSQLAFAPPVLPGHSYSCQNTKLCPFPLPQHIIKISSNQAFLVAFVSPKRAGWHLCVCLFLLCLCLRVCFSSQVLTQVLVPTLLAFISPNRKGASWSYLIGSLGPNFPPDKVTSWIICEQYSEVHMPSTLLAFTSPKREPVRLSSPSCQLSFQSN